MLAATWLAVSALGCSAQSKPDPMRPKVGRGEEYVTGIAAAFYCTCDRWPASWSELRGFDDRLHALSEKTGKPALQRFAWDTYTDASLGRSTEGYLTVSFGAASANDQGGTAVPFPDCSRFDRAKLESACRAAPSAAPGH